MELDWCAVYMKNDVEIHAEGAMVAEAGNHLRDIGVICGWPYGYWSSDRT